MLSLPLCCLQLAALTNQVSDLKVALAIEGKLHQRTITNQQHLEDGMQRELESLRRASMQLQDGEAHHQVQCGVQTKKHHVCI